MPCIICGAPPTKVLRCSGCGKVAGAVCDGAVCQPSLWRIGRHEPRSVVALLNLECASCSQALETVRRRSIGVAPSVVRSVGAGPSVVRSVGAGPSVVRSVGAGPSVVRSVGAGPSVVRSVGAGPSVAKKPPVDKFAAAAERRKVLLAEKVATAKASVRHAGITSTQAHRFPLEALIAGDEGFRGASVALIGLGSAHGRVPPQVQEVASALEKVKAISLTLVDNDLAVVSSVNTRIKTFGKDLKKCVLRVDVYEWIKDDRLDGLFERMISTLTLVYPLGKRSTLDEGSKKVLMAGLVRLLKPGGRLYVDTADSARIMAPYLPEGVSLVLWGDHSGLSYVARSA